MGFYNSFSLSQHLFLCIGRHIILFMCILPCLFILVYIHDYFCSLFDFYSWPWSSWCLALFTRNLSMFPIIIVIVCASFCLRTRVLPLLPFSEGNLFLLLFSFWLYISVSVLCLWVYLFCYPTSCLCCLTLWLQITMYSFFYFLVTLLEHEQSDFLPIWSGWILRDCVHLLC